MDLAEFILQRVAEDEAAAYALTDGETLYTAALDEGHGWLIRDLQARVQRTLAECEAKRAIVEVRQAIDAHIRQIALTDQEEARDARNTRAGLDVALKALALPYASHPDYDESWRP